MADEEREDMVGAHTSSRTVACSLDFPAAACARGNGMRGYRQYQCPGLTLVGLWDPSVGYCGEITLVE
jgi:hypothetical protein